MPEGVLSLARTLETTARNSVSLSTGTMVHEPRRLYENDRMHVLRIIGVHNHHHTPKVEKMNHLGSFARSRKSNTATTMKQPRGKTESMTRFNAGRDESFAEELVRLTTRIGSHLANDGHVPGGVWTEFDNLNNNKKYFRKSDSDYLSQSRPCCGPGSYEINKSTKPRPSKQNSTGFVAPRRRTEAQLEARDRMKHRESVFRKTKDWDVNELGHLQRLYQDLGRPRGQLIRGLRDYEEHLEKFAFRHIQVYHRRSLEEVKIRVDESFRFNKFLEIGEREYWGTLRETQAKQRVQKYTGLAAPASVRSGTFEEGELSPYSSNKVGASVSGVTFNPALPRAPAWSMAGRPVVRTPSPPPGPSEGGSEPFDYRSIGQQITSDKPNVGGVKFTRAGADGATKLTPAEQIALLEPTSTTYTPQIQLTRPRVRSYPWKRAEGEAVIDHTSVLVGPGSYETNSSMFGKQEISKYRSNDGKPFSTAWTARLPRELEPVKESVATSAPPPSPPKLQALY